MKKRIAFLLIVPLLCVLAASLNISYMPTGGLLFVSSTPDDELTVWQKTMPDGTKIAVYDDDFIPGWKIQVLRRYSRPR